MMWLALGIPLTAIAAMWWLARMACDGARLMYVGDIPQHRRAPLHVEADQHRSHDLHPATHGHDLPEGRVIVGGPGGQFIHNQRSDA